MTGQMMGHWGLWLVGGLVLALGAGAFTVVWWKVGDQWADAEHKRFGHGGGGPVGEAPKVIRGFGDDADDGADGADEGTDGGDSE